MITHEELLVKNLELLAQSQPLLAQKLQERLKERPLNLLVPEIRETPQGQWIKGLGEFPFFQKEETFNFKHHKVPIYLLFGVGVPPYLFHLLRALPQEALGVVVVEPNLDILLYTLSQTSVFQALPPGCRIAFVVEEDNALMDEMLRWVLIPMGIFPVENLHLVVHKGEAEAYPKLAPLGKKLREAIVFRIHLLGNSPEDTLLGFRHSVMNTKRIVENLHLKDVFPLFEGRPFVAVATGPSLGKNVYLLEGLEKKCVVVSCDTALYSLLERGIHPQVVVTLERPYDTYNNWAKKVLLDYPEECSRILLVAQSVSPPIIAGRWPGPVLITGKHEIPVDNWYVGTVLGESLLPSGTSVAHMGLSFAFAMQASSIALIGQDLAYSEEGESHIEGALTEEIMTFDKSLKRFLIPGALGGMVETHAIWHTFLQMFERLIEGKEEIYDCTEGGALIRGTVVIPLKEYLDRYVEHGPEKLILIPLKPSRDISSEEKRKERVLLEIQQNLMYIRSCYDQLDKMSGLVEKACAPGLSPHRRQQIGFRIAELLDELHGINPVLSFIGQSYTYLAGAVMAETRTLSSVASIERWKALHQSIIVSHRGSVRFVEQWLSYAYTLLTIEDEAWYCQNLSPQNISQLFAHLDTLQGEEEREKESVRITELLCKVDPLEQKGAPEYYWTLARFSLLRGNADDACRYMERAYSLWEESEAPIQTIAEFFREWGVMEGTHDLCRTPQYAKALKLIYSALAYTPEDEDVKTILQDLYTRYAAHLQSLRTIFMPHGDEDLQYKIWILSAEVDKALLRNNLPEAFLAAQRLIDTAPKSPLVAFYVSWLGESAFQCLDAEDVSIKKAAVEVMAWFGKHEHLLDTTETTFSQGFLEYLHKQDLRPQKISSFSN